MASDKPLRVAVYGDLDLVGDALIKLPFARALRLRYPGAEITWIAGRGGSAFAGALAPLAAGVIDRVLERTGVGADLRAALGRPPDLLIDTQSDLATALALRAIGARRFVTAAAWGLPGRPVRFAPVVPRHLVRRLLALIDRDGTGGDGTGSDGTGGDGAGPALAVPFADRAATLLPDGPRYVAQVLGAGGRHKVWPEAHHVALARALLAQGSTPVLILGPDEAARHPSLAETVPGALFPLQQTDDPQPALTIALAARCSVAVAADSGGGHMMAAAGIPLVSLFGPTDPGKFAPWTPRLRVLRTRAFGGIEMSVIPVAAVLEAVNRFGGDMP